MRKKIHRSRRRERRNTKDGALRCSSWSEEIRGVFFPSQSGRSLFVLISARPPRMGTCPNEELLTDSGPTAGNQDNTMMWWCFKDQVDPRMSAVVLFSLGCLVHHGKLFVPMSARGNMMILPSRKARSKRNNGFGSTLILRLIQGNSRLLFFLSVGRPGIFSFS